MKEWPFWRKKSKGREGYEIQERFVRESERGIRAEEEHLDLATWSSRAAFIRAFSMECLEFTL